MRFLLSHPYKLNKGMHYLKVHPEILAQEDLMLRAANSTTLEMTQYCAPSKVMGSPFTPNIFILLCDVTFNYPV